MSRGASDFRPIPTCSRPRSAFWRSSTSPSVVLRTKHALVLSPADAVVRLARIAEESVQRVLGVWRDLPSPLGVPVVVARDAVRGRGARRTGSSGGDQHPGARTRAVDDRRRARCPRRRGEGHGQRAHPRSGARRGRPLRPERRCGRSIERRAGYVKESPSSSPADTLDLTDELRAAVTCVDQVRPAYRRRRCRTRRLSPPPTPTVPTTSPGWRSPSWSTAWGCPA